MNNQKIVISCFNYTTNFVQPWAAAGYLCYCVDIMHKPGETREGNIIKVGCDIHNWLPPRGDIVFCAFFPPCTDIAVSGARWFKDKGISALYNSIGLFKRAVELAEYIGVPYLIENPVSTISTYWRKPDYMFDPCDYAGYLEDPSPEAYTKRTCLWTGGGFVMPPVKRVEPVLGSKMHKLPPSEDRAMIRSATPLGFARAVFETNSKRG